MFNSLQLAKKYFNYYRRAFNSKGHGIHSPFVFDFILNVLNNKNNNQPPGEIEQLRKELFNNKTVLTIQDLGAGSRVNSSKEKTVRQIAKSALKSKRFAEVLFRVIKTCQPKNIIELGTSLGITTAYLSKANPAANITTIEGSKSIAAVAKENFRKLNCNNIQLLQGNFDQLLPFIISQLPSVDFAYIDGNHRYQPTIYYFHQLLSKTNSNSILVFDDIHWSEEMERAWEEIKSHHSVKYTIDIFFLGFVFFRDEFKVKQHFSIRF